MDTFAFLSDSRFDHLSNFDEFSQCSEHHTSHVRVIASIMRLLSSFIAEESLVRAIEGEHQRVGVLLIAEAFSKYKLQFSLAEMTNFARKHFCVV